LSRAPTRWLFGIAVAGLAVAAQVGSSARVLAGLLAVTPIVFWGVAVGPRDIRGRFVWIVAVAFIAQVLVLAHGTVGGGLQLGSRLLLPGMPALLALAAIGVESRPASRRSWIVVPALLLALSLTGQARGMAQAIEIGSRGAEAVRVAERAPGRVIIGRRHWEAGILAPLVLKGRDILLTYPDDEGYVFDRLVSIGEHRCVVVDFEPVTGATPAGRSVVTVDRAVAWQDWIVLQLVVIR
jgi:hypothetical protein